MRDIQRQIYNSMMKYAKENGIKVQYSRKLTPEELIRQQVRTQEVNDFLARLDEFENHSRGVRIRVGSLEIKAV
tara:strand:- start:22781 stop:23002 length:222 start_codon:yes stop_codon:yes gene_type:complete